MARIELQRFCPVRQLSHCRLDLTHAFERSRQHSTTGISHGLYSAIAPAHNHVWTLSSHLDQSAGEVSDREDADLYQANRVNHAVAQLCPFVLAPTCSFKEWEHAPQRCPDTGGADALLTFRQFAEEVVRAVSDRFQAIRNRAERSHLLAQSARLSRGHLSDSQCMSLAGVLPRTVANDPSANRGDPVPKAAPRKLFGATRPRKDQPAKRGRKPSRYQARHKDVSNLNLSRVPLAHSSPFCEQFIGRILA